MYKREGMRGQQWLLLKGLKNVPDDVGNGKPYRTTKDWASHVPYLPPNLAGMLPSTAGPWHNRLPEYDALYA